MNNLPYKTGLYKELDCPLKLRPYQREAVSVALKRGNGTIVVGTGGGKTFIMATLLNNIDSAIFFFEKTEISQIRNSYSIELIKIGGVYRQKLQSLI